MAKPSHYLTSTAAAILQTATVTTASLVLRLAHERTRSIRQRREGGYPLSLLEAGLKNASHTTGRLVNWLNRQA